MCVCVPDCPRQDGGLPVYTVTTVMIFEWVLICTEASPVVLRAGEECLAYLS